MYSENKKNTNYYYCYYYYNIAIDRCTALPSLLGFEQNLYITRLSLEYQEYFDFHNLNQE